LTYFATFNPDGTRIGSYVDTINPVIPPDAIQISDADQALYVTGLYKRDMTTGGPTSGQPILIPLTPAQLQAPYVTAAQQLLDQTAQTRGYDGILSLCSYATSTNATFQAEGQAGVAFRDAVWNLAYSILAQVQAGTMAQPDVPTFLTLLPAFTWPAAN
jgi:hypothetical protein